MPVSVALVRLLADGSVMVMAGSTEVGQGARTVLSQIAAEELDVPMNQITMQGTDTLFTPFDRSTGASRSTTVMGNAVKALPRICASRSSARRGGFESECARD